MPVTIKCDNCGKEEPMVMVRRPAEEDPTKFEYLTHEEPSNDRGITDTYWLFRVPNPIWGHLERDDKGNLVDKFACSPDCAKVISEKLGDTFRVVDESESLWRSEEKLRQGKGHPNKIM